MFVLLVRMSFEVARCSFRICRESFCSRNCVDYIDNVGNTECKRTLEVNGGPWHLAQVARGFGLILSQGSCLQRFSSCCRKAGECPLQYGPFVLAVHTSSIDGGGVQ